MIEWLLKNECANLFTLFSIIVSGLISLVISKYYYKKGNRVNLEMSVIVPLCSLLSNGINKDNYEKFEQLMGNYNIRYLRKKEKNTLIELRNNYEIMYKNTEEDAQAECLCKYYLYVLKCNKIRTHIVPVEKDGEIMDYSIPYETILRLENQLRTIFKNYNECYYGEELEDIQDKIYVIFNNYTKSDFNSKKKINYFENHSLKEVLETSKYIKKWKKQGEQYSKIRNEFLNLKICKNVKKQ